MPEGRKCCPRESFSGSYFQDEMPNFLLGNHLDRDLAYLFEVGVQFDCQLNPDLQVYICKFTAALLIFFKGW